MFEILMTIVSAGSALDSLYQDVWNNRVIMRDVKMYYDDSICGGALVFRCNDSRIEFMPDGCIRLVGKDGTEELFDNHGFKWLSLEGAIKKLFSDVE